MSLLWRINASLHSITCFLLITIFLSVYSSNSLANDALKIQNLTSLYKLVQDEQGFIWLGGQQGLIRFDGEQSINFSSDNPKQPLPFKWLSDFTKEGDSLIIASANNGLWELNTKTGQSQLIVSDIDDNAFYDIAVFRGSYYFQTKNALYRYQKDTGETHLITKNKTIDEITHTNKHLYITDTSGLYRVQEKSLLNVINEPIFGVLTINDSVIAITANNIYAIHDSGKIVSLTLAEEITKITRITSSYNQDAFFIVNTQGEINKYSTHDLSKRHHRYKKQQPIRLRASLHDSSGVLWLASSQGVKRVYENTLIDHPKTFDIYANANEIILFNDNIVIGSYGAGLQNLFSKTFNQKTNENFSLKGLKILSLAVIRNTLFMGTFDGLWQFNKELNQVSRVAFSDNNKLILKLRHTENFIYIATDKNGLYKYDLTEQKILWNIKPSNGLSSEEVIDILPLDNGKIWLATAKGIDIYNPNTSTVENIKIPDGNKIVSVLLAEDKIFAASLGNGIYIFNQQGHLLSHVGQGINFSGLLREEGQIWASARPGLYRLSAHDHKLSMVENTEQYSFSGSSLVHNNTLYSSHYRGVLELDLTLKPIFNSNVIISKTTVSGKSYLLNNTITVSGSHDLITLDLASLDYRPGLEKKYQYRINNNHWQAISGAQLTLTGLASGSYNIEIMATNSLGQWSDIKAYTEIQVEYPWYWTSEIKIIYVIALFFIITLTVWLLYLRTKSIKHIHHLLKKDMKNYGRLIKTIQRNLQLTSTSLDNNEFQQSKLLIAKSLFVLEEAVNAQEPDNLAGKTLEVAIPFLGDFIQSKYEVKLHFSLDNKVDSLNYELKSDVYKVIFEALMSAIFKNEAKSFNLTLQEVKKKLWLTITSDNDSFNQLNSKVNFDLASYTIRQIINKHNASLNTFNNDNGSSQIVISIPLMALN